MKPLKSTFLAGAMASVLVWPAAAQDAPPPPPPKAPIAPIAPKAPTDVRPKIRFERDHVRSGDARYDQGTRALDSGKWDEARQIFAAIASNKGTRADGALYWKAYAENRLGRRDDAIATLASLRQQYPSSEWLNDAQALTVEVQQQAGKPVDPNAEADEEIKLMAINVLANTEPERAVPLLEKILKSPSSSPRLKDRALFVLTQNRSPQAQQLLVNMAKTGSNPDLQMRALRYMAVSGNKSATPDILAIYNSSHNMAIKKEALNSLMVAKASDELYNIARSEQDASLRTEAINGLGILHQTDKLSQLYKDGIAKETVLEHMFLSGDPNRLLEIVRTEKDTKLRMSAIHSLGMMRSSQAADGLAALYPNEQDVAAKKVIIEALWMQHNGKALVEIAKKESNPQMKREIVEKLTMMKSKEGTDYLLELLK